MNSETAARSFLHRVLVAFGTLALFFGGIERARSQDAPVWNFRLGGGVLVSSGRDTPIDADHRLTLDRAAPVVTIDAIRSLDCCFEAFVSGLIPSIPAAIGVVNGASMPAGNLMPIGVQAGLNYRWRREKNLQFYAGPFVGAFFRDRTVGQAPDDKLAVSFGTTVGIGAGAGVAWVARRHSLPDDSNRKRRHRLITRDEWIVIDGSVRWQYANVPVGNDGRIEWNPLVVTGGVTIHLW